MNSERADRTHALRYYNFYSPIQFRWSIATTMLSTTHHGAGGQVARAGASAPLAAPKSQFMEQHLGMASELRQLFDARPPLEFKKPIEKRKMLPLTGIGACMALFESELPEDMEPYQPPETKRQKSVRTSTKRESKNKTTLGEQLEAWDPESDKNIKSDPYKTIIVARLPYTTTEDQLIDEFSRYGPVVNARITIDNDGKSRGYGFVEFESTSDTKAAYKYAHGKIIGNRKCAVDLERSRTGTGFKPRRLGGGLGRTRSALREHREPPSVVVTVEPEDRRRGDRERYAHHLTFIKTFVILCWNYYLQLI